MMNAKSHTAFSLIELLVSIGIVAIITGLSMAAYGKFTARAQNTRCIEFVHQVRTALERAATAGSTQRRVRCSPRAGCR